MTVGTGNSVRVFQPTPYIVGLFVAIGNYIKGLTLQEFSNLPWLIVPLILISLFLGKHIKSFSTKEFPNQLRSWFGLFVPGGKLMKS